MPLLVRCPACKKLIAASSKKCASKSGQGCGKTIPPDKRIYYAYWRDPNGRVKQKKIGPSKPAAENFLRQVETAIAENKYIDRRETKKVLISEYLDTRYLAYCESRCRPSTMKSKHWHFRCLKEWWGNRYLDELTNKDIDEMRSKLFEQDHQVAFNRIFTTLAHVYTLALEDGLIDRRPFSTKRQKFRERPRLRYLEPSEVERLLAVCAEHLRPIVLTALHTGARKSEILGMRLGKEVDLEARSIHLTQTKNDEERFIPINDTLHAELSALAEGKKPGDYLFTWQGEPIGSVKTTWNTAVAAAGIEDFHFHDLRHTFASNLVMNGASLYDIKELLGHKSIQMTMIYAELSKDHKAKVVCILDRVFGQKAKGKVIPGPGHQSYINQKSAVTTD